MLNKEFLIELLAEKYPNHEYKIYPVFWHGDDDGHRNIATIIKPKTLFWGYVDAKDIFMLTLMNKEVSLNDTPTVAFFNDFSDFNEKQFFGYKIIFSTSII